MNTEVETTAGRIRGALNEGVTGFKGVPYGASTAGDNRFMPPRPPAPWAGVRDALDYVAQSPQSRMGFGRRPELEGFASPPDTTPESEDCLTLNLWTAGAGTRPVMVWLHGGAFSFGSSNGARLDGTSLARNGGVVVVTVNQRLNIFGHLDLSRIGGAEFAQSGNAGTLDMIAALEWVRDNIAAFGGDPGRVTIFGESGGGAKVSTLMAMPRARGLFHRAIVQSGAAIRLGDRERSARLAEQVLREVGLERTQLVDLQRLPVARLLAAIEPAAKALGPTPWPLFDRYPFGPVVDGEVLPQHPFEPAAPALSAEIPLIVGDTTHEASLFLAQDDRVWDGTLTEDGLREAVAAVAGAHVERVVETYRRLHPGKNPAERLIATLTDSNFRLRSLVLADRRVRQGGAATWMYSFAFESAAFDGRLRSPHAFDVPFTFDTIASLSQVDRTPAATALGATMSGVWAGFAETGVPAYPGWRPYTADTRATMVLDAEWQMADDPAPETRALWMEIAGVTAD